MLAERLQLYLKSLSGKPSTTELLWSQLWSKRRWTCRIVATAAMLLIIWNLANVCTWRKLPPNVWKKFRLFPNLPFEYLQRLKATCNYIPTFVYVAEKIIKDSMNLISAVVWDDTPINQIPSSKMLPIYECSGSVDVISWFDLESVVKYYVHWQW